MHHLKQIGQPTSELFIKMQPIAAGADPVQGEVLEHIVWPQLQLLGTQYTHVVVGVSCACL